MAKLEKILEYIDDSILKRAFMFLEEGDWVKANAYLEEVLNQNPENGLAYLGKLMIDTQVHTCVELMDLASPFDENLNYKRCIRYVEEGIAEELKEYNAYIKERNVIVGNATAYNEALKLMNNAQSEEDYNKASAIFEKLGNYENSVQLIKECLDRKMRIKFGHAEGLFNSANTEQDFYEAAKAYEEVSDYYDVEDKIEKCNQRAEEAKQAYLTIVENRKRILKLIQKVIIGVIALVIMIFSAKYVYNNFLRYTSLEQAKVGDLVKFGKISRHGIAWKIYEVQGSKRLLISEDEIGETGIEWRNNVSNWETSSLRQWLNNNFFVIAFNESEKKLIKLTNLKKDGDGEYNDDVSDLVFLLSVDEIKKYFKDDSQRRWDMNSDGEKFVNWMTRTPCNYKDCFVSVRDNGTFDMKGVNYVKRCPVRGALWVDVKSTGSDVNLYVQKENERKEKIRLERLRIEEEKRKAEEEKRKAEEKKIYWEKWGNIIQAKVGDYVKFGRYHGTILTWRVLSVQGTEKLLITEYGIDNKRYNDDDKNVVTWENCTLRKWLNNGFYYEAFNAEEKDKIMLTKVNNNSKDYGRSGGNNTEDKVFCINNSEAYSLFKDDKDRRCTKKNGEACFWWLRSPGPTGYGVGIVERDGMTYWTGSRAKDGCVRPALWVKFDY